MSALHSRIVYLTRKVEFSAAHRLHQPELSDEENRELYGKCAYTHGHGHNYVLEATFKGTVEPKTHMVVNYNALKRLLDEVVLDPFDHRNLNHEPPFNHGILPTLENIVIHFWDRISGTIQGQEWSLHRLRLASSGQNWVEYQGE